MKKIKVLIVIALMMIISLCFVKLFHDDEINDEKSVKDKGSYSYYYTEPSSSLENSGGGIGFYGK